jgi:indole-3-glycerol phosphate synthase
MSNFLRTMAAGSAERAASIGSFSAEDFDLPVARLDLGAFDLVAEIKERSPSEGILAPQSVSRAERARQYVQGGAAAISVLTEPSRFGGDISHLREVAEAVSGSGVPVMRKDFLVDRRQLAESRAGGASGVLLIAAISSDAKLAEMLDCAFEHSLFVLLESFDENDVARSRRLLKVARFAEKALVNELLLGVNSRNLRTLEVDSTRLARLVPTLPNTAIAVAESGLRNTVDAALVASLGYRAALVGTALMRDENPSALIADMLVAGRASAAERPGVASSL